MVSDVRQKVVKPRSQDSAINGTSERHASTAQALRHFRRWKSASAEQQVPKVCPIHISRRLCVHSSFSAPVAAGNLALTMTLFGDCARNYPRNPVSATRTAPARRHENLPVNEALSRQSLDRLHCKGKHLAAFALATVIRASPLAVSPVPAPLSTVWNGAQSNLT